MRSSTPSWQFSLTLWAILLSSLVVLAWSSSSSGSSSSSTSSASEKNNPNNNKSDPQTKQQPPEEPDQTCYTSTTTPAILPQRHSQDSRLWVYSFHSISSTQDEAKRLCEEGFTATVGDETAIPPPPTSFVVTTREQSQGRGTNGRVWMGGQQPGNVFVTLGIRQDDWMRSGIPLTLLPLQVGSMVAQHVHHYLMMQCRSSSNSSSFFLPTVTVKWPNDVLVNEQKIAGILIESSSSSQGGWFLIGIGVNLAYAPSITNAGPNRGRPATSLASWCHHNTTTTDDDDTSNTLATAAEEFGVALGYDLHSFVQQQANNEGGTAAAAPQQILENWKKWIDWDLELELRDTPGREKVKMVDVLPDGRIQVEHLKDGRRQTLVSDYFL